MTPQEFIFEYLKADQDTGAGSYEKMISAIATFDWAEVKAAILKLRYFYFLRTSYWSIISAEVKRRSQWKCACGCREDLEVHHTEEGNKHHGEEHILLYEGVTGLECLCRKCHQKNHGSSIKAVEKKRQRNERKEKILNQLPYYPNKVSEGIIKGSSVVLTRRQRARRSGRVRLVRSLVVGVRRPV